MHDADWITTSKFACTTIPSHTPSYSRRGTRRYDRPFRRPSFKFLTTSQPFSIPLRTNWASLQLLRYKIHHLPQPNHTTTITAANMVSLLDLFHSKLELFRLEQRYTRRRNKRTTFTSEAQYVDGEYIYSPSSAKFSQGTGSGSDDDRERVASKETKVSRRKSMINWGRKEDKVPRVDRGGAMVSVREVQWEDSREDRSMRR